MCNTQEKLTKYTGYYRCVDEISNLKIRIRLKEEDPENINANKEDEWHIQEFCWQEKHFSKIEKDFYGDINNCISDLEKIYNEIIVNAENRESSIFFTYVNKDGCYEDEGTERGASYLQKYMEDMGLNEGYKINSNEYEFERSLTSSIKNNVIQYDFENMFILADLGGYVEDVWIKNEQLLCTIKFDRISRMYSVYPDFTNSKPYSLKIGSETSKNVLYFIEHCSAYLPESEELKEYDIMRKVKDTKRSQMRETIGDQFFLPPKNKLYVFLFFDILCAKQFEHHDLYLHYHIDLPMYWSCEHPDTLRGTTQTCHGMKEDEGLVHFGHNFDVVLEYDIQSLQEKSIPETPYVYFEIISKETWERYRTEGLAYKNLPVSSPGCYSYTLRCFRFETEGPSGGLRRFFIGDGYNYKDVRCIGLPQQGNQMNVFNKFAANTTGTGQLDIRLNVIHQSQAFLQEFNEGDRREKHIYDKLNASSLIRSVNQVLHAFRKARRNMIEVRKTVTDRFQ